MAIQTTNVFSGSTFDIATFAGTITTICESFRTATNDPKDQIAQFIKLATYKSPVQIDDQDSYNPLPLYGQTGFKPGTPAPQISTDIATVEDAVAALCRRTALASLALACNVYQPSSVTESIQLLQSIVPVFDAEILYAADKSDDESYNALRDLRSAVVADLESRCTSLPEIITVNYKEPLPSVVAAFGLYSDATRSLDLELHADPPHPLFMPLSFQCLSA